MYIKQGNNVKRMNIFSKVFMSAFADEGGTTPPTEPVPPTTEPPTPSSTSGATNPINFEDLIQSARKQEKDKLYPQIKKLEEDKKALIEKNNAHLLNIGEKDSEISSLKKEIEQLKSKGASTSSDNEKKLQSEVDTLKSELDTLKASTVSREDIEKEIKAEYEVKLYREQKLREVGTSAIPELITGTTKEEIDSSLELAKKRFQDIQQQVLGGVKIPTASPSTKFNNQDLKIEDLLKLDPRSPEYAELRKKLGLK